MDRAGWPQARAGMAVGLLGGSFDPAHGGHVRITRAALARFRLDRVWWLVSPGNPLKPDPPAALDRRVAQARALIRDPRVAVGDIEARLGTRTTADLLGRLLPLYPGVRFVWLMGADNFATLHRWDRWEQIMATVPVGVLARPGHRIAARLGPAARRFRSARLPAEAAGALARAQPPAWCFVNLPLDPASSTAIRDGGGWAR